MILTAIDPGTHCGWAELTDGVPLHFGTLKGEREFWNWLTSQKPDLFVVENFRIRPGKNFAWGDMPPLQYIGAIKYHAACNNIPVKLQEASVLPVAVKMAGFEYKKGSHVKDTISAIAHGVYYYRKHHAEENR